MFKEIKGIAGKSNQIKDQLALRKMAEDAITDEICATIDDQLALRKMAEDAKVDRTETCFRGKSRQTRNDYIESIERIKLLQRKYPY